MSSLNWEARIDYLAYDTHERTKQGVDSYELWGIESRQREWYHDCLARIDKEHNAWVLYIQRNHRLETFGPFKTVKEAKAMGITIVAMEGIKHE